jgi:hypothetical protein
MRPITTATMVVLAFSACSRTGTIEGDIYFIMHDGEVKRGTGARVYLVPERADRDLWATADTLCTQAWHWQRYSHEKRFAAIERDRRFWEKQADSVRQEAEGLPPAQRGPTLTHAEKLLAVTGGQAEKAELALLSEGGVAAASWLRQKLQAFYASASVDSAKAGVDGHYVLDDVPRGTYVLVALPDAWMTDFDFVGWHTPVDVSGGLRTEHLDNDASLYLGLFCSPDETAVPATGSM